MGEAWELLHLTLTRSLARAREERRAQAQLEVVLIFVIWICICVCIWAKEVNRALMCILSSWCLIVSFFHPGLEDPWL